MSDTTEDRAFAAAWKIVSAWDGKITKPVLRKAIEAYLAARNVAEMEKAEAFDRIVAARKRHVDAVAAYNARRELANAERMRGSWAIKLDEEYHAMSDAQSEFHRTVQDLADAALRDQGNTHQEPRP